MMLLEQIIPLNLLSQHSLVIETETVAGDLASFLTPFRVLHSQTALDFNLNAS